MSGYVRGASRVKIWMAIAVMMFAAIGHAGTAEDGGRFLNGSKLLGWCESDSLHDQGACSGYVAGLSDITSTYEGSGLLDPLYCHPEGVTVGQLKKVVIKGLNERPEILHEGAAGLVAVAFMKAFPCN